MDNNSVALGNRTCSVTDKNKKHEPYKDKEEEKNKEELFTFIYGDEEPEGHDDGR